MAFNLDTCRSKDELETFAQEMFGVDLDKRKKLDELKAEIRGLIAGNQQTLNDDTPEPDSEPNNPEAVIRWVFNQNTQSVVMYHDGLKKRLGVDLTPCQQDGTPL